MNTLPWFEPIESIAKAINPAVRLKHFKAFTVISFHENSPPLRDVYKQMLTLKMRLLTELDVKSTTTGYENGLVVDAPLETYR